ncbi:hypothetical protein [Cesiribacter sp. SM1]|uniref:hypothetical protein n=1 Tax=Cesiribacter sp. SM1 TaxID=2861196 RepID=UPI001CD5EC4F|nr:hypothetical protein [Cesiribacter sp. SM1]
MLGTQEVEQTSPEGYARASENSQELIEVGVNWQSHDGILQTRSEFSELNHTVRRFPLAVSLLFLLSNENVAESPGQLFPESLSFSPPKDRLASYHILRI